MAYFFVYAAISDSLPSLIAALAPRYMTKISFIIPSRNKKRMLRKIERVIALHGLELPLEIIILDDCPDDESLRIAQELSSKHAEVSVLEHGEHHGKVSALHRALGLATGDLIGILDADMEYNPVEYHEMLKPCLESTADLVLGTCRPRSGFGRVLYLWHQWTDRLLVFGSSLCSSLEGSRLKPRDANCVLFSRDVIRQVEQTLEEGISGAREMALKAVQSRVRAYEHALAWPSCSRQCDDMTKTVGLSRFMRIAPLQMRMLLFLFVLLNVFFFSACMTVGIGLPQSLIAAYTLGNSVNLGLCAAVFSRREGRRARSVELAVYLLLLSALGVLDYLLTYGFMLIGMAPFFAKLLAALLVAVLSLALRWRMELPANGNGSNFTKLTISADSSSE